MSAQTPHDERESETPARSEASEPRVTIPRPMKRDLDGVPGSATSPELELTADASPPVSLEPMDEEREETAVENVPAGLLALSARPPPRTETEFEDETRAFTAPPELIDLARRGQRSYAANKGDEEQGSLQTPPGASAVTREEVDPNLSLPPRVAADTVNTVVAPPVPARNSSLQPSERAPAIREPKEKKVQHSSLWSSEVMVLVVMLCLLVGYWVSILWV